MSASTLKESVASPLEQNPNKCALKLLGLDSENLTDEEILEFISNFVQPSAITGLFYDSYNCFYVLHLSDIESTCLLIGKTLQIGTYHVSFLPLSDSFVIGNVYPCLSNLNLREIFSTFGNVLEVKNHHVLPNSSKYFHVLSGTREISFLLSGPDCEVPIPVTVIHPPYTFHVKRLCPRCLTQGHSLMNCPAKEVEAALSEVAKSFSADNSEKNVVINIMPVHEEMTFEVSNEVTEKDVENASSNVTSIKKEVVEGNEGLAQEMLHGVEKSKKMAKKEKKLLIKNRTMAIVKNRKRLLRRISESKKKNSSSENSEPEFEHTSNLPKISSSDLPPSVQACIMGSEGVLPARALVELMFLDARNRGNILNYVLEFSSNVRPVLAQLRKLQSDFEEKKEVLSKVEYKFRHKVWSIIRVLKRYLHG